MREEQVTLTRIIADEGKSLKIKRLGSDYFSYAKKESIVIMDEIESIEEIASEEYEEEMKKGHYGLASAF